MPHERSETVGVIVARFQVPELHAGHRHLIVHVRERHENVLIVLGVRKGVRTKRDPLTFEEREAMVHQVFPGRTLTTKPLHDHPFSHEAWSRNLDALIMETFPNRSAVLYGSRGSFIPLYTGAFSVIEVPAVFPDTGSAYREAIVFPHTPDARAALIYETEHRYPIMRSTSDLAITCHNTGRVLLIGKKIHDGLLSFAGGHADKSDGGGRAVAEREGREEIIGIRIGPLVYVDTISIDDPRYRGTPDGIMTTFYRAEYEGGDPSPGDDADSVHWVARENLSAVLVPWHRPLGELLNRHWIFRN